MRKTSAISTFLLLLTLGMASPLASQTPSSEEVLAAAREALGGDQALAAIEALSATGEYRRLMGEREISGQATVELRLPDKLRREEEMGIPGGPQFTRITVLNGEASWSDGRSRGGGPGVVMRFGQGGPGGRELSEEDRARMRDAQTRRMKAELERLRLAWLLRADGELKHVATAEAEDGKADVFETTAADGRAVRLFIDQVTHLPLILTYEAPVPRMRIVRGGERPSPEEIERMRREPPQMAEFELRFDDYREVKGVMLPHLLISSANGNVVEEWTIEKYEINPSLEPERFEKKKDSN